MANPSPKDQVAATRALLRAMMAAAGHGGPNATAAAEAANVEIDKQTGRK
jgi:hypothetical protein